MSTATVAESTMAIGAGDELYEIIDGQRVRVPPMGVFAVWIASELHSHLACFVRGQDLGRALTEALFHLPAPVNRDRRPDVAFVSYQRWAKDRPIPRTDNSWEVVPNLAVEVVSPSDSAEDLEQKIAEYFQAGVQLVWVIFPMQSKTHVYAAPTQIRVLTAKDVLDGGDIVPGFQLPLDQLFPEPVNAPHS